MRLACFLLLVSAVAVAGCGETVIDADKAEDFIAKTVEEQTGARVKSVDCPDDLTAKKGATFECTVTGEDGTTGATKVTEKDAEGNVSVSAPFIHTRDLEEQIAADVTAQDGGTVELDCPEIVVGEKGGTFDCEGTRDGEPLTVRVTQKDDKANVRYEVIDQ